MASDEGLQFQTIFWLDMYISCKISCQCVSSPVEMDGICYEFFKDL